MNDAIVARNDTRILMTGTRDGAIGRAEKYFDDGGFLAELQRRVAIPTTSQEQDSMPALQQYVSGEMTESLEKLGYDCTVLPNPRSEYGPFLIARRVEDASQADRADLRPWRRDPRPGGAVAAGPVAVEDRGRGRPHVRPRHRRQQGPAHDQHRSPRLRAAGARQPRLQLDHPDRDRRGNRLARAWPISARPTRRRSRPMP